MSVLIQIITDARRKNITTPWQLQQLKNQYCEKYALDKILNIDLLHTYHQLVDSQKISAYAPLEKLLKKRGVRTLSGIAPITVLTKPYACPGNCLFCPSEPGMPKSYLSNEPAVQRAVLNQWSGMRQVQNRLRSLHITGHVTEKNDLIIAGGTWSYYPKRYQTHFIKSCFDGFNTWQKVSEKIVPSENKEKIFTTGIPLPANSLIAKNLEEAKKRNETTKHRVIGLSLETRPDYITPKEIIQMRTYGCTRVQLGVQSVYDDVLKMNKRGHGTKESIEATRLLKDAGFKVDYHMMPNLYGATKEQDTEMFRVLFNRPDYQPDQLKIYPCSIIPGTGLERMYKQKKYIPYTEEELFDLLYNIKKIIPPYVRISRLIRDIPSTSILVGSKRTNLRQLLLEKMAKEKIHCRCIRCREVREQDVSKLTPELIIREYNASRGKEFFISYEDVKNDILFGFCRLRIPSHIYTGEKHFIKELQDAAIVRELHVYGIQVPLHIREEMAVQHAGFGKKLMHQAEIITKQQDIRKLAVIAGIGVREYYRKLGYKKKGEYMVKKTG